MPARRKVQEAKRAARREQGISAGGDDAADPCAKYAGYKTLIVEVRVSSCKPFAQQRDVHCKVANLFGLEHTELRMENVCKRIDNSNPQHPQLYNIYEFPVLEIRGDHIIRLPSGCFQTFPVNRSLAEVRQELQHLCRVVNKGTGRG